MDNEYTYNKTVKFLMGLTYATFSISILMLFLLGFWSKSFASVFFSLAVILILSLGFYYNQLPYRIKKIVIKKDGLLIKYWFATKKQFNWEKLKSLETRYSGGKICTIESYLGPISFRIDDFFGLQNGSKLVAEIIDLANLHEMIDQRPVRILFLKFKRIPRHTQKFYGRL